jgi:hypothetical protein
MGAEHRKKKKITLIIDAGGVKMGGAAIGALRVLDRYYKERDIEIASLIAVSGGALAASMYVLGYDYAHISKTILHYWRRDLFTDFNPSFWNGLIRGDKIEAVIREVLQSATFSQTKIPFSVLVSNIHLSWVEPILINTGFIHNAVRASLSVPFYLRPKVISGQSCFDGKVSVATSDDVIAFVKPNMETHYVGIQGEVTSFLGLPIGIYNALLKMRSPFSEKGGYVPPLVRKIIIPTKSRVSIWEGDALAEYLLLGERVARESIVGWE